MCPTFVGSCHNRDVQCILQEKRQTFYVCHPITMDSELLNMKLHPFFIQLPIFIPHYTLNKRRSRLSVWCWSRLRYYHFNVSLCFYFTYWTSLVSIYRIWLRKAWLIPAFTTGASKNKVCKVLSSQCSYGGAGTKNQDNIKSKSEEFIEVGWLLCVLQALRHISQACFTSL